MAIACLESMQRDIFSHISGSDAVKSAFRRDNEDLDPFTSGTPGRIMLAFDFVHRFTMFIWF